MAIPAIKAFRRKFPDCRVGFATLQNRGDATVEILSPFLHNVYPVLSEPWDWVEKYNKPLEEGRKFAMNEAYSCAQSTGYKIVREITMDPRLDIFKVNRVAMEMGVHPLKNTKPELLVSSTQIEYGRNFVENMKKPVVFFHAVAGNVNKTLTKDMCHSIIRQTSVGTLIECGSTYFKTGNRFDVVHYQPVSIMETLGILVGVDKIVCIDSIVMHLGYALSIPMKVIFTITPPEQVFGVGYKLPHVKVVKL